MNCKFQITLYVEWKGQIYTDMNVAMNILGLTAVTFELHSGGSRVSWTTVLCHFQDKGRMKQMRIDLLYATQSAISRTSAF